MALTLEIESVDKTSLFQVGGLSIQDDLNSRNTCGFVLFDSTGIYRPEAGQDVLIQHDAVTIFGGTIDTIREVQPNGTDGLEYAVSCVDYNQIADRHLVARVYENKTLGYIAADIVTQDLAGEGVTVVHVQTGPTIVKLVCNYQTVAEVFNALAELTGYAWNIDYTKDLHFFARETYTAPITLTDADWNCRDFIVTRTRDQYRNRQYVRAGQDVTDSRIETFIGDGERKTFNLSFPVAKVPSLITVNAVSKTIGIRGLDTGKDWYWSKGEKEISQDDGAGALTSAQTLAVTYQGMFPILLLAQDDAEITGRIAVEGGSGIYDAIEDDQNIDNQDLATQKADALLRRFGNIPRIVEFETDEDGLASGQLITITLTAHGLTGDYLIDSVSVGDEETFLRYRVRALDGESLGGWQEFFRRLAAAGRKFVIRENEVLILLRRTADTVTLTDTLEYTSTGRDAYVTSYPLFTRASTAYDRIDGHSHAANVARYETGPWAGYLAALAEEGTTNLLTANQASIETDLTGWVNLGTTLFERSLAEHWHGIASLHYQATITNKGGYTSYTTVTASLPYAGLARVKGTGNIKIGVGEYTIADVLVGFTWSAPVALSGSWQSISVARTFGATGVKAIVLIYDSDEGDVDCYVDGVQLEQRAYATSFQLPGSARAAESLTVPLAGMSPVVGTWEQWVYVDAMAKRQVAGQYNRIFNIPRSIGEWGIYLSHAPTLPTWYLGVKDDAGTEKYIGFADSYTPDGWHLFKVCWPVGKVFVDNVLRGTIAAPVWPSAFGAVGSILSEGGTQHFLNTLAADIRASNIDRSAETPSLTVPLPVDDNTIYLLSLNGDLYYDPSADIGFCEVAL